MRILKPLRNRFFSCCGCKLGGWKCFYIALAAWELRDDSATAWELMVRFPVFYLPPNPGQTFNSNLYFLVIHDDTILPYIFLTSGSKSLEKFKNESIYL